SVSGVLAMRFTPDGRRLAIAADTTISLYDLATGREEQSFAGQRTVGATAGLSRDRTPPGAGALGGTIPLWGVGARKLMGDGHGRAVASLAFSPDGTRLASGASDTTVLIWDVAELRRLATTQPLAGELAALWEQMGDPDPVTARNALVVLGRLAGAVAFLDER